jgi:hypothetical protein
MITVNDKMQSDYSYDLVATAGAEFDDGFTPFYTPKEMLQMGVFEGKYMNDCTDEFPEDWFVNAKLSDKPSNAFNFFGIKSRTPLSEWRAKGWIFEPDPRGWFQWYCRYYQGRRIELVDKQQIKRWRAFVRHAGQIRANCKPGDVCCRPRQRQGLLQWSHNPLI